MRKVRFGDLRIGEHSHAHLMCKLEENGVRDAYRTVSAMGQCIGRGRQLILILSPGTQVSDNLLMFWSPATICRVALENALFANRGVRLLPPAPHHPEVPGAE